LVRLAVKPAVKQFRIYLKSELGKLGNQGDASWFLRCVSSEVLKMCGVPADPIDLAHVFGSQERVNAFVDSLANPKLEMLTKSCDREWRKNGVFEKLTNHSAWREELVSVHLIDVQQAEPRLAYLFRRHAFELKHIAGDCDLWTHEPYAGWNLISPVHLLRTWFLLIRFKMGF